MPHLEGSSDRCYTVISGTSHTLRNNSCIYRVRCAFFMVGCVIYKTLPIGICLEVNTLYPFPNLSATERLKLQSSTSV